jgi:hypothetical protein
VRRKALPTQAVNVFVHCNTQFGGSGCAARSLTDSKTKAGKYHVTIVAAQSIDKTGQTATVFDNNG